MEFAAERQASLREFTASGVVEGRENGGRVAPFSGMSWEVRGNGEKPLLHLSPDLEHSFSGNYARGLLRRGSTHVAVLAVPGGESSDAAGNSLTFALLGCGVPANRVAGERSPAFASFFPRTPAASSRTVSPHSIRNSPWSFTNMTPR